MDKTDFLDVLKQAAAEKRKPTITEQVLIAAIYEMFKEKVKWKSIALLAILGNIAQFLASLVR